MIEAQYRIVFKGKLAEGISRRQARVQLMKAFSLEEMHADTILSCPKVVLKRGLPEAKAMRYLEKLSRLGLIAIAEMDTSPPHDVESASGHAPPAPTPALSLDKAAWGSDLLLPPIRRKSTASPTSGPDAGETAFPPLKMVEAEVPSPSPLRPAPLPAPSSASSGKDVPAWTLEPIVLGSPRDD
jgi:hypothetical protein